MTDRQIATVKFNAPEGKGAHYFEIVQNMPRGKYTLRAAVDEAPGTGDVNDVSKTFSNIHDVLRLAKSKYGIGIRHWNFIVSLASIDAYRQGKKDEEIIFDKSKRGLYLFEGIICVIILTLLGVGVCAYYSTNKYQDLSIWQHLYNGWVGVKYGLTIVLFFGFSSMLTYLGKLGAIKIRWRFFGGVLVLAIIVMVVSITIGEDFIITNSY